MRSPTRSEIQFLKQWVRLDRRESGIVYKVLQSIAVYVCIPVFWAIYLSTSDDGLHYAAFIICAASGGLALAAAELYRGITCGGIDFSSIQLTRITGTLRIKDVRGRMYPMRGPVPLLTKYHIGTQESFIPKHWLNRIGSFSKEISADVYLAPWGKAFPVSLNAEQSLAVDKETGTGSIGVKPVNMIVIVIVALSGLLTPMALFLPSAKKTIGFAPVDASRIASTKNQQTTFPSVHDALSYRLKPYQPITIEKAVILPRPVDDYARDAVVIDPPAGEFIHLSTAGTQSLPVFNNEKKSPDASTTGTPAKMKSDEITSQPSSEKDAVEKFQNEMNELIGKEYTAITEGFVVDGSSYPDHLFQWNDYSPTPFNKVYEGVMRYLDTLPEAHAVKGILIPRASSEKDYDRFKFYIDRSHTDYARFSAFFLTFLPIVLMVMIMRLILQGHYNVAANKRLNELYGDVTPGLPQSPDDGKLDL